MSASAVEAEWDATTAVPLVRVPEGGPEQVTVDVAGRGYRIAFPRAGVFVLPGDGRVMCAPEAGSGDVWARYLTAQVLPLAAVMAGIEVVHASAVVLDNMAVGVVGPSGVGKSTIAGALVRQGGALLTDDVLALTREGGHMVGHLGPNHLRVGLAGNKSARVVRTATDQARLAVLFFLDRTAGSQRIGETVAFREIAGATFSLLVRTPERLERHLELCASLAGAGAAVRAEFPAGTTPDETASALMGWLASGG